MDMSKKSTYHLMEEMIGKFPYRHHKILAADKSFVEGYLHGCRMFLDSTTVPAILTEERLINNIMGSLADFMYTHEFLRFRTSMDKVHLSQEETAELINIIGKAQGHG